MPLGLLDRWRAPPPDPARVGWLKDWTYAHRGLHGAGVAENSFSAFTAAIEAGLAVECDVVRSADGRVVVFHDAHLDRVTDQTGSVAARTMAELAHVSLQGTGDTIPPLRDMLDLVAGRVPVLIEIKSRDRRPISPLCRAVLRDLEGYGGLHAVMSFDPRVSRWFADRAPQILRGLVVTEENARTLAGSVRRHLFLWRARPDFLAYDIRDLPSAFAASQRARGLPVTSWTVSTPAQLDVCQTHADACIGEHKGLPTGPVTS